MSFEKIYYRMVQQQMARFYDERHQPVIIARNRVHRWWLRLRNPGVTVWLVKDIRTNIGVEL